MALNTQQQEIVGLPLNESALVLAGAGSGKTTVVANRAIRIAAILPPGQQLQLLTFGNKAAKEMKERVQRVGGADLSKIRFDTFHSFGMRLIRDDPAGYDLTEGFSLLSESDVKRSISRLAKSYGLPAKKDIDQPDKKRLDPMAWLNTWSLARQAGYDVNNRDNFKTLLERLVTTHVLKSPEQHIAWMTLSTYEKEKKKANALDFDDLLWLPLLRIARNADYQSLVRSTIGAVSVDEFQDTNLLQYTLVRYVALGHCGVTAVGDDDQSIYGWRGAEVSNLKRFQKQFAAKELRLERNYRSTQTIVDTSVELIRNNLSRLEKVPYSEREQGEALSLDMFCDHREMADTIAQRIAASIEAGTPPKEIAVLYRTNRMALLIEQSLRRYQVPYHVVGGMSLFDRAEVAAVTSALRLARNASDSYALKTLVDYIDGFGSGSAYILAEWLEGDATRSLMQLPETVPGLGKAKLDVFRRFYADLIDEVLLAPNATEFVKWVVDGPMQLLEREKDDDLRQRKSQHLSALGIDIQGELDERKPSELKLTWRDVIIEVALRDARQSESSDGQVTLSTLHRAKGLEYREVHIPGASEGLMPLDSRSEITSDEAGYSHIEEERRLAFVGLTRAKLVCRFYHADRYGFPGSTDDRLYDPSRFLLEMKIQATPSAEHECSDGGANDDFDIESFRRDFARFAPRGM